MKCGVCKKALPCECTVDYVEWVIQRGYTDPEKALGQCLKASSDMVAAFPELEVAHGYVVYESGGHPNGKWSQHTWCVDPFGRIVDPTVAQYSLVKVIRYEEWTKEELMNAGKCMQCGTATRQRGFACSPECQTKLEAAYGAL